MLPTNVAIAVRESFGEGSVPQRGWYADDSTCEGAAFHSPNPLTVESVALDPNDDLSTGAPEATLCPTCTANLGVLKALLLKHDGDLAWTVRREFGNKIRALAMKGWDWHVAKAAHSE